MIILKNRLEIAGAFWIDSLKRRFYTPVESGVRARLRTAEVWRPGGVILLAEA